MILESLRDVCGFVKNHEEEFIQLVTASSSAKQEKMTKANRKKLVENQKRIAELDRLIRQIYEDNVNQKLSDKRFEKLSDEYEQEQEELEQSIATLQAGIENSDEQATKADKFIQLTREFTDFTELTTPMLMEFIEKIVVHERVKDGWYTKSQQIDIFFNFVGMVGLPELYLTESEDYEISEVDSWKRYVPKNSVFVPLGKFLERQRNLQDKQQSSQQNELCRKQRNSHTLTLTYAEIEDIIGRPLCASAYKHRSYWYPSKNRPASNVIFNAGFDVKKVDLKTQTMLLVKTEVE